MDSKTGMYSNPQPGLLALEMSLHRPIPPQNPNQVLPPHPAAVQGHHEGDYHQFPSQGYQFAAKSKNLAPSDEDEPGIENSADDGKRKLSPWHRMKWTDNMVRLLITAVFYVGDEVGSDATDSTAKKKFGGSGGGGALQKKGKWKSVSQVMMEKGFYVSPQQCEDKFNDLNKRYKRVNDILGKGIACRVVENQSLLDTMDHLSPKSKDEVRKLLNSKHLFFREMCAYHNSCGHSGGTTQAAPPPPPQQRCLHSTENTNDASKLTKFSTEEDDGDDSNNSDEDDENEVESGEEDKRSRKRCRKGEQMEAELVNVLQDGRKSVYEKREWMKNKVMMLEEESVGIRLHAYELEKQRFKWLKFRSKKEREMEMEKLAMERSKLENERMLLMIRQQELELMENEQCCNNDNDPSK